MATSRAPKPSLPALSASLAVASLETIARRTAMMLSGTCPPSEYQRMVTEKMLAMQQASFALMTGQGPEAVLRPYHRLARANAKRLRRS
jgi:hypothetical protein